MGNQQRSITILLAGITLGFEEAVTHAHGFYPSKCPVVRIVEGFFAKSVTLAPMKVP